MELQPAAQLPTGLTEAYLQNLEVRSPRATSPSHHTTDQDDHGAANRPGQVHCKKSASLHRTEGRTRAENYWAWRASFCNTIDNIGLTVAEETDLLIKWLGKESLEQACRLRAAHIREPQGGLKAIWQRLEECYGTPEAIEGALFARLKSFPKITNKEPAKLRELADLLHELQAAKQDGFRPGLAYLDTARGVAPIILFPPFSVFVKFIHNQAKARNNPSFTITPPTALAIKRDKTRSHPSHANQPVAVHKTQVADSSHKGEPKADTPDPSEHCPIHQKPLSLGKCRGFRDKLLTDRWHAPTFSKQSITTLKTCAGSKETSGRRACGYVLESLDEKTCFPLPVLIECNELPNNSFTSPTPEKNIATEIPLLDHNANTVFAGKRHSENSQNPKANKWTQRCPVCSKSRPRVGGDVCLGTAHWPSSVTALKTSILENGRPSYLTPCYSHLRVKDLTQSCSVLQFPPPQRAAVHPAPLLCRDDTDSSSFTCTDNDHQPAPSIEDLKFLKIMDNKVF
ncbi:hypothetical protein N1851_005229 [Merluccius polli]|uniref:Uncharacterized protein n=1 Tax=Merluccius polli TaxID=89951 RepID=A0AA47P9B5_MERPO|nr:hypothetical protein N1851_005229 [Merluccius polli]